MVKLKFLGIGWKSKALLKRATLYLSVNKLVVDGCCIQKGEVLYSYLCEDALSGRKIVVTYLDGRKKEKTVEGGEKNLRRK